MIKILHNVSCSKSRAAVQHLEDTETTCNIRNFIEDPLNVDELKDLLKKLDLPVHDIIRDNEVLYQTEFADKNLNADELIEMLAKHPSLLQRPIIIKGDKAIIGRPASRIDEFLKG
ncbi:MULTISPECIES: ArsC/Spx/MgsR family protein [Amniculibacterium]|uniref:ArsC/Spx/MgsR family protein n=1 Tax=Amniculibacterium TaxID=2715289 RepID=UPI000F5B21B7|nr:MULTISPECIES: ArsC/Spx/MgsR family protein [Amniculibacterium]